RRATGSAQPGPARLPPYQLRARMAVEPAGARHRPGASRVGVPADHGGGAPGRLGRDLARQRWRGGGLRYVPGRGGRPARDHADGVLAVEAHSRAGGRVLPAGFAVAIKAWVWFSALESPTLVPASGGPTPVTLCCMWRRVSALRKCRGGGS